MRLKAIQRVADVLASGDFSESAMALCCKTLGVKRASMSDTPATTGRDTVPTANGDNNSVVEAMVTPASEEGPSLAQVAYLIVAKAHRKVRRTKEAERS